MNKLGLIGGTSWHSTIEYYKYINQYVNDHFGDNTNPPLVIYNVDQSKIHQLQVLGNWSDIATIFIEASHNLEKAGVDKILFCANTPHKVYNQVLVRIKTSILHIADATATAIKNRNIKKVCFLGTKYSMTEDFIKERMIANDLEVITPKEYDTIDELHRIIKDELTYGKILPESKAYVLGVINSLVNEGAEGVVLGCTEFPLMLTATDLKIPIFNTTEIHAEAGAKFILGQE